MKRIAQYVAFCVWLLSPSIMRLRCTHVVTRVNISFLFIAERFPLFGWTIACSSTHKLKDVSVVSSSWLSWLKLLCPFTYRVLCAHQFTCLLGEYLGVRQQDHRASVYFTSREVATVSRSGRAICIPTSSVRVFGCLTSLPKLYMVGLFNFCHSSAGTQAELIVGPDCPHARAQGPQGARQTLAGRARGRSGLPGHEEGIFVQRSCRWGDRTYSI